MKSLNAPARLFLCTVMLSCVAFCGCLKSVLRSIGPSAMTSEGITWSVSHEYVLDKARGTGKPILANFTGSDWCTWCHRLEDEVFLTREFQEWAADNVLLLEVDFPENVQQPDYLAQQNQRLKQQYAGYIQGFPTVLLLSPSGQVIGQLGYVSGGPTAWIQQANQLLRQTSANATHPYSKR